MAQPRRFEVPQFLIVDYHPISKTRVTGTPNYDPVYEYVYRVDVRNSGARAVQVMGQVTSKRRSVVVTDAAVSFGTVDRHEVKASQDTITIRAGKFFDRRLDRSIRVNNQWRFEEDGFDPEDDHVFGLLRRHSPWEPDLLDSIYNLKFSLIFDWEIASRPDANAPTISNLAPTGNVSDAQPLISASYVDTGGSIATAGVVLRVDGIDVTSAAAVSAAGISYRPAAPLSDGTHNVALTVPDNAGNVSNATWSFSTDTQAPVISNSSPIDTLRASPTVTISAQYSDAGLGVDVTSVHLLVDGQDVTALATVTSTGVNYQPSAPLADGSHSVLLRLADAIGHPASLEWSFGVDASGPVISTLLPAAGAELAADAVPTISATFSDSGSGLDRASVHLALDGIDVTTNAQVTAQGVTYTPAAALSEGTHSVLLRAADVNGNVTEASWTFVTRSSPQILGMQPNDALLNASATVVIFAQFRDIGAGIDTGSIRLTVDGVDFTADAQVTATSITLTPIVVLPQGLHVVSLTVADLAGNSSASIWRFTIDTGLPVVAEQQPHNTLVSTAQPTISAAYSDTGTPSTATGIDHARTRLHVNGIDITGSAQFDTSALPHRIAYTPATPLPQGNQTIRLFVADNAGNDLESIWSFSIDVDGPAITDLLPADGAILAADALVTLSGAFVDAGSGINVGSTVIELDGQNITAQSHVTAAGFNRAYAAALTEGTHTLSVSVSDAAGNVTSRSSTFITASAPVVNAQAPNNTFLPGGATPTITAALSDIGAGIDVATIKLFFNGVDVTQAAQISATAISYTVAQPLADDTHSVRVVVADGAGNSTESVWQFGTATAPVVTATAPGEVMLPPGSRPVISAMYADSRVGIDPESVRIVVNGQDVTAQAVVTESGVTYTPSQALAAGPYTVYLDLANRANASTNAVWGFQVDEEKTYTVQVTNPAGAIGVLTPRLQVEASASSNKTFAHTLTINGQPMRVSRTGDGAVPIFVGEVNLQDGVNTLLVRATFDDGEMRTASREVTYDAPPRVTIVSPVDKAVLGRANPTSPGDLTGNVDRPVTIQGRISKPVVSLQINQQSAQLLSGGTEFRFDNFFLHEGMNLVTVVATDGNGRIGSAAITVSVDQTAPILTVEAPLAESVTSGATIDVRGMVNDAVEGFLGAAEPTVTVNGRPAQVFDRYYLATDVPLQIGANTLTVIATDQFGNARTREIQVSRVAVGSSRLTLLSGNHQLAAPVTELTKPLVVVALNSAGEPLANLPIRFDVTRGTGSISTAQGQPIRVNGATAARNLTVSTDAAGQAQVWLTVGKQSGAGANVVTASHQDLAEEVTFVATTQRGQVVKVLADTGINQFAETGSQPLELLSVVVRDREDNLLPNVPVVFKIEQGDAFFNDAAGNSVSKVVLNTDKNGLTALRPTLGSTPGLVRISARALRDSDGDVDDPADLTGDANYQIQVKQAQDGPASFKGFVFTDKGEPLPGARVSIGRTALSSTSDSSGGFEFMDVPPGRIDLFVDGRTSGHENKTWPSLHFESYIVRGQENQLAHPIYLPPLLMTEAKQVGGNEDVILTMPGLPGFQMKVKANSVTFPDGSRAGTLVVSPVTADRLPMPPPAGGALFGVPAWTIQPAGTRFDPPIEVRLPNSTGQPAGDNIPVVQWDHDLGQFVPMGRATVSEDGAYMITDAGSGITKAGWGGACVYDPSKCAKTAPPICTQCQKLDTSGECPTCVRDPERDGTGQKTGISGGWRFAMPPSAMQSLPISAELAVEGQYAGEYGNQCCPDSGSLGRVSEVSGSLAATLSAQGRLWGWDWHYGVDGAVGLFIEAEVKGGFQASLSSSSCENKTELRAFSGFVAGEIKASAKLEINGGKDEDYGLSFVPLSAGGAVNLKYYKQGEGCASEVEVSGFVKGEAELGNRKFTFFQFASTRTFGPYPEWSGGVCGYLFSSTEL